MVLSVVTAGVDADVAIVVAAVAVAVVGCAWRICANLRTLVSRPRRCVAYTGTVYWHTAYRASISTFQPLLMRNAVQQLGDSAAKRTETYV
jgi:hypothetical protein